MRYSIACNQQNLTAFLELTNHNNPEVDLEDTACACCTYMVAVAQEEVDRASNTLRCDADALEANRSDSQAVGISLREEREALLVLAGQLQVCLCSFGIAEVHVVIETNYG